jgi:hypothetical protein
VTRGRLLELVRGTASDAVRLEVESHLADCEDCRTERARYGLLGWLKEQPAPALGAAANRRVLARLLEGAPAGAARGEIGTRRRGSRLVAVAAGLAFSAAAVLLLVHGRAGVETLTAPRLIENASGGTVAFGGARVAYAPGTKMLAEPARRRLGLDRGEVDVDVDPQAGLGGHFRVATERFVVEVIGTHFIVTPSGVQTLRGRVRVLDLADRELAVLGPGESWTAPTPAIAPSPPPAEPARPEAAAPPIAPRPEAAAPSIAPRPEAAAPPPQEAAMAPIAPRPEELPAAPQAPHVPSALRASAAQLLSRGRSAMSDGDADGARAWIARARDAHPTEDESAALDLLEADAWLVTKQPDAAISAYRRVARRWSGTVQAETATFAVGQLLVEGDSPLAAETALTEYLAHYPHGRFAREAQEQLAQLRASK